MGPLDPNRSFIIPNSVLPSSQNFNHAPATSQSTFSFREHPKVIKRTVDEFPTDDAPRQATKKRKKSSEDSDYESSHDDYDKRDEKFEYLNEVQNNFSDDEILQSGYKSHFNNSNVQSRNKGKNHTSLQASKEGKKSNSLKNRATLLTPSSETRISSTNNTNNNVNVGLETSNNSKNTHEFSALDIEVIDALLEIQNEPALQNRPSQQPQQLLAKKDGDALSTQKKTSTISTQTGTSNSIQSKSSSYQKNNDGNLSDSDVESSEESDSFSEDESEFEEHGLSLTNSNNNVATTQTTKTISNKDLKETSYSKAKDADELVEMFFNKHTDKDFIKDKKTVFISSSTLKDLVNGFNEAKLDQSEFKDLYLPFAERLNQLINKYKIPFPDYENEKSAAVRDLLRLMELDRNKTVIIPEGNFQNLSTKELKKLKYDFKFDYSEDKRFDPTNHKVNNLFGTLIPNHKFAVKCTNFINGNLRIKNVADEWNTPLRKKAITRILKDHLMAKGQVCVKKNMTHSTLRSGMTYATMQRQSDFRSSAVHGIITLLQEKCLLPSKDLKILDTSAGFGGRPLGALSDKRVSYYFGVDPNSNLFEGFKKLKDLIPSSQKIAFDILCKPAEELKDSDFEVAKDIVKDGFDLLLTSPPYGNNEIYTSEMSQSSQRYMSKKLDPATLQFTSENLDPEEARKKWLENFLYKSFYIAWRKLKENGLFAINIADYVDKRRTQKVVKICIPMLKFLVDDLKMEYLGCSAYQLSNAKGKKLVEPIWILRKTNTPIDEAKIPASLRTNKVAINSLKETKQKEIKDLSHAFWKNCFTYFQQELQSSNRSENEIIEALAKDLDIESSILFKKIDGFKAVQQSMAKLSAPRHKVGYRQ